MHEFRIYRSGAPRVDVFTVRARHDHAHLYIVATGLKSTDKILWEGLGKVKNNEKIKFKFVSLEKELAGIKNIHAE